MTELTCPICLRESVKNNESKGDSAEYECATCGQFNISRSAEQTLRNDPVDYRFSAWIREHQEFEREPPKITTYILEEILKNLPDYKISEKQMLLMRAIERRTNYPGAKVLLSKEDYPLAWAKNVDELRYLLNALAERKLISLNKEGTTSIVSTIILPDGWDYIDKNFSQPALINRAFVAMSFNKKLDLVWEKGIKPAIKSAGYIPHRVDKEPHIERIDAKIIADIKDSRFVIADITEQKQGVYFEAGFALGLKLPVIWCVKRDDLKNVHFDTRQYYHVVWDTPDDLKEKLYDVICAVIGKSKTFQEED